MKLAIIARMDDSGLGHQTRDLVRLLKPDKVIATDFNFYNGFKQYPEWYANNDTKYVQGFLEESDVHNLTKEVDVLLTAETFYNNNFIGIANLNNCYTINQINYEFFEPLSDPSLILPDKILMPSYWHLRDLQARTAPGKVEYLPPPIFLDDWAENRSINYERKGKRRFLHVAGKMASHDRAGTKDLLAALQHVNVDFELVIKIQKGEILATNDSRVIFDYSNPVDERELYRDFDAMIMPRRYAGLNLPMNEALASGLPVIMTNIEPNNMLLPAYWLVESYKVTQFFARTPVEVYSADHFKLGKTIEKMVLMDENFLQGQKTQAYLIAKKEFDHGQIYTRFNDMFDKLKL